MKTENPEPKTPKKSSLKKKLIALAVLISALAYAALSYLNKSPDPTTWESIRTDYKNIK